jgi:MFS family permease
MTEDVMQDHSRPQEVQAGRLGRLALPASVSFWVSVSLMVVFMYAAAAPTPLYRVYQEKWHFSAATLTAVFAIYVLFLVVTLLTAGSLSDHIGRRPLIITGIVLFAAACVLFLVANGVALLFVARALQGTAVGVGLNTLGAVLMDLRSRSPLAPLLSSVSPNAGLATGALLTAIGVQYGPAPTQLVWWLLLAIFAAAFVLVAAMPESGTARPGALASLRPHVSVPRPARGAFTRAVPALVAVWALGGFYLSLGPNLAAELARSHNLLWGGAVAFLLTGIGAATALAVRNARPATAMLGGCLALMAGAGVSVAAIETGSATVLLFSTGLAGFGFGPAFLGAYRTVVALAAPAERAGLIAAVFTVSYLSMGLPALIAGIVDTQVGLHGTALVYSAAVAGLAGLAASTFAFGGRSRTVAPPPHPAGSAELPPGPCTVPPYVPAARRPAQPVQASR